MIENVPDLKPVNLPMFGGIDEESPVDSLAPEDAVKMTNWRLSKNGKRIQKRAGLQEEDTAFGEDVYGLATYYNATPAFCKLAVIESEIQRKIGAGAWVNIFDFTSNIDHTVKVHEIQDKQFIITEKGARVILSNGDVRQIGITAPATRPTLTPTYVSGVTPPMNDLMAYADQAAMDAVWTDGDLVGGVSTLESADPYSTPGPNADTKYMKLLANVFSAIAHRTRQLTADTTNFFSIEVATYFKTLNAFNDPRGSVLAHGLQLRFYTGTNLIFITISADGVWITPQNQVGRIIMEDSSKISSVTTPLEKWIIWRISVDATDVRNVKIQIYRTIGTTLEDMGAATIYSPSTDFSNYVDIRLNGAFNYTNQEAWIDYIRLTPSTYQTARLSGLYRYAVSYVRTGNYGCESNPIKSIVGAVSFSGAGVNDMTVNAESEYTGPVDKTIRIKVKTAANPDVIQWSEDGGLTWSGEMPVMAKCYIAYGLIVDFATLTGHTATNYWEVVCYAISAIATFQQINLTNLPTSSDGQVNGRKIYRTLANGADFFLLTTIYDNTTTYFYDNVPDQALGDEMEEDRDLFSAASSTIGKFSEWWDNRLWIADHSANVVYYSAVRNGGGVPEEFSLDERFVPLNKGDQDDVITAMIAFKDALYVFKRNDIFIIQKTALGYSPYHLNSDVGCIADNGVISVNDMLMFPSERGLEIYDGVKPFGPEFAVAINKTFLTADPAGYKYMSIAHDKQYNEVWFSIPSRLSGAAAITTVWNYVRNRFYYFQFYKVPSCLVSCKDSTGKRVLKMGTRDGFIDLCDYGTADHTTAITATYRKGWLDMHAHGIGRLLTTKYELPATKTITANLYVDMQSAVFRTAALTGVTPGATDIDLRRVIGDKSELGSRHRWISVEYVSADDAGGDVKINEAFLFVVPKVIKKKTYAN